MEYIDMNVLRLFALFILSAASFSAYAQPAANLPSPSAPRFGSPVAATVNDDVISQRDVEQRVKLTLLISNLPDTPDMRSRVLGPLLRRMIDEDLKIQEATRQKLIVSSDDIKAQIDFFEQQNHMPPGGMIKLVN